LRAIFPVATIATLAINLIGNVSGLKSALGEAQQSIKATSESLKSVGTKMTAAVSLPILGVAGAALKGAAEMEQLEVAFTTMLRSGDKAKALMADLTAFSAETPFELPEVVSAGKMLLAYGVAADDVKGTLRQLGDIAAGVGAPIGDIAYLFGTARVQGRLFAADINQFTNRGIPIISALAKTMGVAEGSIKKMTEEGKIGFPELQKALDYLTNSGGQFEGLMAAQSQTLAGLFSTLKDNIGITLATIGRSIVEAFDLRTKLGSALETLGRVKDFIVNLAQTNPALLKTAVIIAAVAAAIGPLLVGLGAVVGAVGNLVPVVGALTSAFAFLLSPLGLAIAGLAALFYFDVGGIRSKFVELGQSIWEFGQRVVAITPALATDLKDAIEWIWTGQAANIDWWNDITDSLVQMGIIGQDKGDALAESLYNAGVTIDQIKTKITDGWIFIRDTVNIAVAEFSWSDFIEAFTWDNVVATMNDWGDYIQSLDWSTVIDGALDWAQYIGDLQWDSIVTALDWALYITELAWDTFLSGFGEWGTYVKELQWSVFVTAVDLTAYVGYLAWTDYLSGEDFSWSNFIADLTDWSTYVKVLNWPAFLGEVIWSNYISKLEWTDVTSFEWSDYITQLSSWADYIKVLNWPAYLGEFAWSRYISQLTWSEFITALNEWGTWISALSWSEFIVKLAEWSSFISPLSWTSFVFALNWSQFVPRLQWPSISWPGWKSFIPSFSWPQIPSVPQNWWQYFNPFGGGEDSADNGVSSSGSIGPNGASTNALGTQYWRGGATWVGDGGKPELVVLPRGSQVIPERFAGAGAGGPAVVVDKIIVNNEADAYLWAYEVDDLRRRRRR